ncbi:MAG: hypothetical protein IJZ65_08775 [Ruminiclostridium sp.]|nr:hypothetical protein [Ruminiclostridium sp.]
MKKFLSVLLAAMVLTAAGCGPAKEAEEETTTVAEEEAEATTTESEETEAETTTTEATEAETTTTEATTEETTEATTEAAPEKDLTGLKEDLLTDEMKEFIETLKAEVPIYADYMYETSLLPTAMGFAYEADMYGTGTLSKVTMDIHMEGLNKMALITKTDGEGATVILDGDKYYMVSDAEKTAMYMTLSEEEMASMADTMKGSISTTFDPDTATFETGTKEYNGTEYLFETINTVEMGDITIYADKATKEVKYIESAGITMEITFLTHEVDPSVYEIPSDYVLVDLATMFEGQ